MDASPGESAEGAPVRIYTTTPCGYCAAAKRLFLAKGVAFEEVDVTGNMDQRAWLAQVTGQRTMPQIFIGGHPYGGYSDVVALDRRGELDPLLGLVP